MTNSFPLTGTILGASGLPIGLSNSDGESPLSDLAGDAETSALANVPLLGPLLAMSKATSGSASGWFGIRGVTLILGFLLIAAGLFSHPAVRETIVKTVKKGSEAAAIAA